MTTVTDEYVAAQAAQMIDVLEAPQDPREGPSCPRHKDLARGVANTLRLEIMIMKRLDELERRMGELELRLKAQPPEAGSLAPGVAALTMSLARVVGWPVATAVAAIVWMLLGMPVPH